MVNSTLTAKRYKYAIDNEDQILLEALLDFCGLGVETHTKIIHMIHSGGCSTEEVAAHLEKRG